MTETELVGALAARLRAVTAGIEGIAGLSDYEDACDLARARECVRQMRWAAKNGERWGFGMGELGLAPDDWTHSE